MYRMVSFVLFLTALCTIGAGDAKAAGLGFYGTFGGGTADWSPDYGLTFKKHTTHAGFGIVMDTAPAQDKLFNYHLTIGYDRFGNRGGSAWGEAQFNGFVISNNFGFGALINPTTRLWFGPEVRIEWAEGSPRKYPGYDIDLFGLGIGPVVGINFNFDDRHTFVVKTGYQVIHYVAEGIGNYPPSAGSTTTVSNFNDYDVTEKLFYLTLEFLFRTSGDRN